MSADAGDREALELAVIVPCRNGASTLEDALSALTSECWDGTFEVIVVDNGSTDGSKDVAARFADRGVRVVSATDGTGVAYARNAGAAATNARSVAFCDADDVVHPGWLAAIGDALRDHELVAGAVDAAALNPAWLARSRPGPGRERLPRFGSLPFASGGNGGVRRERWVQAGGYDEAFRGLEDIEFSLRLRALGVRPVFVPEAVISYRYRAGYRPLWRQGVFYGRGRPALRRQARADGLATPSRWEGLRSWVWLGVHLPGLRHRSGRYQWVWVLANRFGVAQGWLFALRRPARLDYVRSTR